MTVIHFHHRRSFNQGDWPFDRSKKPMRDVRKGHRHDKIARKRRATTEELMKKMPQMLLDYKSQGKSYVCDVNGCSFAHKQLVAVYSGIGLLAVLIAVYSGIGILGALFLFFRTIFYILMGLGSSKYIFYQITNSLIQAPMQLFDSTPLGRIMSRVSSDLNIIDIDLPYSLGATIAATLNTCATLAVLSSLTWQVLFVVFPMIYLVVQLQRYYISTARELMRINGTTKSPIANHLGESISGATTIRAFKMEKQYFKKNLELINRNSNPFFHTFSANEWLIQRLEILSAVVLCSSALTVVMVPKGTFRPGFVDLALSYGLSLNLALVSSIQIQWMLSNYIVSKEHLKQYMHIPREAPEVVEDNRPPSNWPSKGKVELKDLKVRYRTNSPLVLKGISCTFEEGHKIGIVGRTGSGKSTLRLLQEPVRNVFTFVATLRLLQEPVRVVPDLIAIIIQAKVSLDRIEGFLRAAELQENAVVHNQLKNPKFSLVIKSGTLS